MNRENSIEREVTGRPTGDQVEEIYRAIAQLQKVYDQARSDGVEQPEIPEHLRPMLKKLRDMRR